MDLILGLIIFLLFIAAIVHRIQAHQSALPIEAHREKAHKQFRSHKTSSTEPRFVFDGEEAEIIQSDETVSHDDGIITSYTLTCYARNPAGEYFMFVSNDEQRPFFKHISHTNAKIILEKKYRPPAA